MDRRQFLLTSSGRSRAAEISCERLYMQYVDADADEAAANLFDRLRQELVGVDRLRVRDAYWLAGDEQLRGGLRRVLKEFRARGGRVIHA